MPPAEQASAVAGDGDAGGATKTPSSAGAPWRGKGVLIAGFVGVGVVGLLIGRASSSVQEPAPPPSPSAQPSASSASSAKGAPDLPQHFDLNEIPSFKSGTALRPMDRDIFDKLTTLALERTQMRDVFPDRPYRVTFLGSLAERRIGLVTIDLDRDGKIDERWDLKKGEVTRNVVGDPNAGGQPVMYRLAHGRWQPH